jgi:hypothetical protein
MNKLARFLIGIAGTAALIGAATAGASPNGATGNAQAIAFARSMQSAYDHVAGIDYTQQGYATLRSAIGKHSFFNVTWGSGTVPTGWVSATERAVVALHNGAVVWAQDELTPPRCTAATACATQPVEIVEVKAGSFWRFAVSGAQFHCFNKLPSEGLSFPIGSPWISVGGDYTPLVQHGTTVTSRFSYLWSTNQTATETDTVSASTKLISAYRVTVSKGKAKQPGFTFAASYTNLTSAPAQPKLTLCK